jgi:tRNA (adenine37-N6)-methyltransferase
MPLLLEPIGEVRCRALPVGKPWGGVLSELHFRQHLTEGLRGIEQFSHLLVVFWMHQASYRPERDLVRHPEGREDMPRLGIFAQRASTRPNAMGVSVVRLLSQDGAVLSVQGLDAFDGSPILDIKPYFSEFDRAAAPLEPEWVSRLMRDYF